MSKCLLFYDTICYQLSYLKEASGKERYRFLLLRSPQERIDRYENIDGMSEHLLRDVQQKLSMFIATQALFAREVIFENQDGGKTFSLLVVAYNDSQFSSQKSLSYTGPVCFMKNSVHTSVKNVYHSK